MTPRRSCWTGIGPARPHGGGCLGQARSAGGGFSPLALEEADEKPEESDWKEAVIKKKEAVTLEKKPPEIKRGEETPVRLEGAAPKLELDMQGAKPRDKGQKRRKPANTLVPPKTMDPEDIFMDDKRAPYDEDDPYDDDMNDNLSGSFSFEDEEEGSFFMRHLRGIVGLALFVILLLMFVIFAFSRAGQVSLARVNAAWSKDAYSTLGYQYYQAGDYSQAGLYYERALQRDPNSYSFASSAAMAYLEAGDNEKAAAMLKRCAEIDPTKLEPYVYLLKLYPDAASRPWDITQLLQQGYQRTGDARLNVTGLTGYGQERKQSGADAGIPARADGRHDPRLLSKHLLRLRGRRRDHGDDTVAGLRAGEAAHEPRLSGGAGPLSQRAQPGGPADRQRPGGDGGVGPQAGGAGAV